MTTTTTHVHTMLNFARLHPMATASLQQADPGYDIESWSEKNARIAAIRKERSRDAARSRRGKENYEFYELAKLLPLPAAITSQLDKASIIRLTIGYLHMRHFSMQGDPPWHSGYAPESTPTPTNPSRHLSVLQGRYPHVQTGANAIAREVYEHHLGSHILQSLDGFLFALHRDGRFLYISETVSIYLGLSQVELTGCSVFDYVHPGDHAELADQLGMKLPPSSKTASSPASTDRDGRDSNDSSTATSPTMMTPTGLQDDVTLNMTTSSDMIGRAFLIRMKSTLTKRGVHFKSSGYKVIHVTGALRPELSLSQYHHHPPSILGFVAVGYSLPPPTISEIRLDPTMFMCKVDLDLTITFCEAKIHDFLDHQADSVVGKSLYSYIHAQDIANMRASHQDLLNKGQTITKYYRWMLREGGYIWLQTTGTLCYAKNSTDSSFIFINQVISLVEYADIPMDISQVTSLSSDDDLELLRTAPSKVKTSPLRRQSGEDSNGCIEPEIGDTNNNNKGHPSVMDGKTRKRPQSPERRKYRKLRGSPISKNESVANHEASIDAQKSLDGGRESKRKANARLLGTQKPKLSAEMVHKQVIIRADSPSEKTLTVLGEKGNFGEEEGYVKRSKDRLKGEQAGRHQMAKEVKGGVQDPLDPVSPTSHLQASTSLLALSSIRHEEKDGVRVPSVSWDNPPNRELPPNHNGMLPSPDNGTAPRVCLTTTMNSATKSVFTEPSPKTPDSLLTPPLSDSAKNQYPQTAGNALLSPKARLTNAVESMAPLYSTESPTPSRYSMSATASNKHETVYPIPSPLTQSPSVESMDSSMRNAVKQEPASLYNARMLGSVSSPYAAGMAAYANYGQYNNLPHYGAVVNLTSRAYQSSSATPYGSDSAVYKNYHHAGPDIAPMDLSYNGVTGFPIVHTGMSPANASYFPPPSRLQYNLSDTGHQLGLSPDKSGLDRSKTTSV